MIRLLEREGFTVIHTRGSHCKLRKGERTVIESPAGICIDGGDGGFLAGNRIKGTTGTGILFKGAGHHVLVDTKITGKPVGIDIQDDVCIDDFNTQIE
jgi:hypothetical protein